MVGKFNKLSLEQSSELSPNIEPDAFAVAPEFDSTEQLRVEIDDTDESRPVHLLLFTVETGKSLCKFLCELYPILARLASKNNYANSNSSTVTNSYP